MTPPCDANTGLQRTAGADELAMADLSEYVRATAMIESSHPAVLDFVRRHAGADRSPRAKAVRLFLGVRDKIRYDPYHICLSIEGIKASTTLRNGYGWCVPKATLLASCCRAVGIPARLGFADVRNHLSTERLRRQMKTDVFRWHAYCSILLEGRWVKATPAFNVELCRRFGFAPLEFDGHRDALLHPFDAEGRRHMEYLAFRGEYADVPIAEIRATFEREYPFHAELGRSADFAEDVEREAGGATG